MPNDLSDSSDPSKSKKRKSDVSRNSLSKKQRLTADHSEDDSALFKKGDQVAGSYEFNISENRR